MFLETYNFVIFSVNVGTRVSWAHAKNTREICHQKSGETLKNNQESQRPRQYVGSQKRKIFWIRNFYRTTNENL